VFDDHGLLFDAVAREWLAGDEAIVIAAEGVAAQQQIQAALMLPDMGQLVDQQRLKPRMRG
jgi:hypothetical protein